MRTRTSFRNWISTILLPLVVTTGTHDARADIDEARVQSCVCYGMRTEVTMPGGGKADCVAGDTVTEIDRTSSWAEAIGQSLYYAEQTGKRARVVLFCDDDTPNLCLAHRLRIEGTIAYHRLPIELVPMDGSMIAAACGTR